MKTKILFLGLVLSLFTVSCTKDSADNSTITADEATVNAKIDIANDDVSDIVETQFNATMDNSSTGKTSETATTSSPSHPIIVMTMDMTATFPDGRVFQRVGTRTREIIEGFSTLSWTDNIYKVTGSWSTTFPNTTVQTSTISNTNPLIVKMSCIAVNKPLLVQGVITFVRNSHVATLDYGTGDCDNIAIFTIDGVPHTIIIGN